ncbi:MAG: 16S rRNA (cytidine(1402)-2'-O)-methyltransferase [Christensenellales bacterium]|jgi:16S rRNA (cytidine1402-2'-O)-methyltransferase|nr:16S rRNA (cytidine(1402)-2'-O)-methyltransferase [Christensenellaceae bacterium]
MSTLYVVATPIGNLSDISFRAIEMLKSVSLIAAEDTRHTQKLLNHYDIKTPLTSYHKFNERSKGEKLIERMLSEEIDIALVSDAGTPCISDPGAIIVRLAIENGILVRAIPGASAVSSALSISGFINTEYAFYGFMPRKKSACIEKLKSLSKNTHIAVIYESPHRIFNLFSAIDEAFPEYDCAVFSDITKLHEKHFRGKPGDIIKLLSANEYAEKGEYTVLINVESAEDTAEKPPLYKTEEAMLLDEMLSNDINIRAAMDNLIKKGHNKNSLYKASLRLKELLKGSDEL